MRVRLTVIAGRTVPPSGGRRPRYDGPPSMALLKPRSLAGALLVALLLGAAVASGCGGESAKDEPVTLTVTRDFGSGAPRRRRDGRVPEGETVAASCCSATSTSRRPRRRHRALDRRHRRRPRGRAAGRLVLLRQRRRGRAWRRRAPVAGGRPRLVGPPRPRRGRAHPGRRRLVPASRSPPARAASACPCASSAPTGSTRECDEVTKRLERGRREAHRAVDDRPGAGERGPAGARRPVDEGPPGPRDRAHRARARARRGVFARFDRTGRRLDAARCARARRPHARARLRARRRHAASRAARPCG